MPDQSIATTPRPDVAAAVAPQPLSIVWTTRLATGTDIPVIRAAWVERR